MGSELNYLLSQKDNRITLGFLTRYKEFPENQYFERKGLFENKIKPTKIAEEIIGMLNADGGVLVFGISDDGKIQDLNQLEKSELDKYRNLVFDFIKPPANVEIEEIILGNGELIFLYHVEQDYERVFFRSDNEKVFLRMSDENRVLDREQARKLEYDKGIRKFEDEIREDFDSKDFRKKVLAFYKEKLKFDGNIEDLLVKRHLGIKRDGKYFFKNSAILLFSENPEKYIPSASVRYVRYSGITAESGTEHNVIKDEHFESCVPRLIEILRRFIYASLRDYYFLNMVEGKFIKISEYPEEAWLEGIVNALCHRSYNIQGNLIYIKHFDDRLEISNSGPLPAQVTVENIKTERFSRNPRIARVLSDMGYVRELNEGVSRIYKSMEQSMLSEPEYYDKNNIITLILRNKVANHEKSISEELMQKIEMMWKEFNETERKVLEFLFLNHKGTVLGISEDIHVGEKTIRQYLNKFCSLDLLIRNSDKIRDKNAVFTFKK